MRPIRFTAFWLSFALLLCLVRPAGAVESYTFFAGTQYPLKVYFLTGDEPGPTVMVQGGIQGDEISGFVTAQLLTRVHVKRGRLIIIPRANVPSISARKRQVNVDLNRRFDKEYNDFFEDRLARVIRYFVHQSDAFIHLHEGSGFYNPKYVDELHNPKRYGQSVIIDTSVHDNLLLADLVNMVLERVNEGLTPQSRRFRLFNTNTFSQSSGYKEQRKSLTFHALSRCGIPALAIEVSKNIRDLSWKVQHQFKASLAFLEAFGVQAKWTEAPLAELAEYVQEAPRLYVNGRNVSGSRLSLPPYTTLAVTVKPDGALADLDAVPALFASDRQELDLTKSPRMTMTPFSSLEIRSDGERIAEVKVEWKGSFHRPDLSAAAPLFAVWRNGRLQFVPSGQVMEAVVGDQILLEGIWNGASDEIINVKGLVTQAGKNDGQDAGCEIILDPGTFIERYLLPGSGDGVWTCRVVRETPSATGAQFLIRMRERTVSAVSLMDQLGQARLLSWSDGGHYRLSPGRYAVTDVWSNGSRDKILAMIDNRPLDWDQSFNLEFNQDVTLSLRQATTFQLLGSVTLSAAGLADAGLGEHHPPKIN